MLPVRAHVPGRLIALVRVVADIASQAGVISGIDKYIRRVEWIVGIYLHPWHLSG